MLRFPYSCRQTINDLCADRPRCRERPAFAHKFPDNFCDFACELSAEAATLFGLALRPIRHCRRVIRSRYIVHVRNFECLHQLQTRAPRRRFLHAIRSQAAAIGGDDKGRRPHT